MSNVKHVCNVCGKPFDVFDEQGNYSIYNKEMGYGSENDGSCLDLHICCDCMDAIIASCEISPLSDENE